MPLESNLPLLFSLFLSLKSQWKNKEPPQQQKLRSLGTWCPVIRHSLNLDAYCICVPRRLTSSGSLYYAHRFIVLGHVRNRRHWTQCSKEYKDKYNVDFAFHKLRRATTHARLWGLDFQGPHARAMDTRSGKDTHTPRDVFVRWVTSELRVKNGHCLGVCFNYIPVQRHNLEHARRRANPSVWMEQTGHDVKRREIMPER